ncbi:RHS repeat-associated core domain-containing protein [Caloramator proteoclasticus]|uniref:RHS repeat-associated core domain-containing protein n=1 Tax=Caloramator proteoclasticus DSM 10124 TaxID=1121262 RepID=A0A1M4X7C6_9CLOT|nr:RHS repeat-associated core domain-containing protein [Caloramator proteoclasticus]SHE89409.1 RHS repeat-associated core domain-containing protein [Caloramator proteoclasticus DSM 10124]
MTTASGTTYFHYSRDKVVYETDENNNIIAEYTYDAQGNPATIIKNGVTYYYHVNGHGDVMALTDESGNVVAEYNYDAYGNIVSQSGSMASANPLRYAGYRYDEAIGLYYLMARYYDANVGRFITRDTFHGFEDEPRSLNQYAYTNNNPVMFVDPSGHLAWWVGAALWGAAGSLVDYWWTHRNLPFSQWNKEELAWSMVRGAVIGIGLGWVQSAFLPVMRQYISYVFDYYKFSARVSITQLINLARKKGIELSLYYIIKRYK